MAQHKVAGAGTGKPASHPEFGRYFTLAIPEITTQKDLVLAIREGRVLPVESAGDGFAPIEAAMRPRNDNNRDRSNQRGGRDRNRQGRPGNDKRGRPNRNNDSRPDHSADE